ncbi:hypothetical protein CIK06_03405 [Plantactinospora sp. KBS50]|nr:hypothetical protein CIK06_03405 [Plantactinospora sp. KBS50]
MPLVPLNTSQPLQPIHEHFASPSPTGSNDSTDSVSLSDVPGADVVADTSNGMVLARFGKNAFYWLESAGAVTSLIGAGLKGAAPGYAEAASYVQGAGGLMTAVGSLYTTYEEARKAMQKGQVDPERGLPAENVSRFTSTTSKPSVQLVGNLVNFAGGVITAASALAAGRTDIAFAGSLISGAAAAVKSVNTGRDDPGKTGKHFLIEHRAEITDLNNWNRTPSSVRTALTKFYEKVDKKATAKQAAAQRPQQDQSRPAAAGRSSSVSYQGGYGYQQNPAATWVAGSSQGSTGQGSSQQQRRR